MGYGVSETPVSVQGFEPGFAVGKTRGLAAHGDPLRGPAAVARAPFAFPSIARSARSRSPMARGDGSLLICAPSRFPAYLTLPRRALPFALLTEAGPWFKFCGDFIGGLEKHKDPVITGPLVGGTPTFVSRAANRPNWLGLTFFNL